MPSDLRTANACRSSGARIASAALLLLLVPPTALPALAQGGPDTKAASSAASPGEDVSAGGAATYQAQANAWLRSMIGPTPGIRVEDTDEHYSFGIPIVRRKDAPRYTFNATPVGDGKWRITDMRFPSPAIIETTTVLSGGTIAPIRYDVSIARQGGTARLDTTFATPSTWTGSLDGLAVDAKSQLGTGSLSIEHAGIEGDLTPITRHRVNVAGMVEIAGYRNKTMSAGDAFSVASTVGRLHATYALDDVSRSHAMALARGIAKAMEDARTSKEAGAAAMRRLMILLSSLGSGMSVDQTFEDAALAAGRSQIGLKHARLAVVVKEKNGKLSVHLIVAVDGPTLAGMGIGRLAPLIPSKLEIPLTITGVPTAELKKVVTAAFAKDELPTAEFRGMLKAGQIVAAIQEMMIDVGPTHLEITGRMNVLSPSKLKAAVRITATNIEDLQRRLADAEKSQQAGLFLTMMRGMARAEHGIDVWDVSYGDGGLLVNGQRIGATPRPDGHRGGSKSPE